MAPSARSRLGLLAAWSVAVLVTRLAIAQPSKPDEYKNLIETADLASALKSSVEVLKDATKGAGATGYNAKSQAAEDEAYMLIILGEMLAANGDKRGVQIRDAAIAITEAMQDYRAAAVKMDNEKQAEAYQAIKAGAARLAEWEKFKGGEIGKPELEKQVPLKHLMAAVKSLHAGAFKYQRLSAVQFKAKPQNQEIILNTTKLLAATVGMVAHTPAKDPDPKAGQTSKLWEGSSVETRKALADMLKAAKAGDAKAYKEAYGAMDKSCNSCHDKYRS